MKLISSDRFKTLLDEVIDSHRTMAKHPELFDGSDDNLMQDFCKDKTQMNLNLLSDCFEYVIRDFYLAMAFTTRLNQLIDCHRSLVTKAEDTFRKDTEGVCKMCQSFLVGDYSKALESCKETV